MQKYGESKQKKLNKLEKKNQDNSKTKKPSPFLSNQKNHAEHLEEGPSISGNTKKHDDEQMYNYLHEINNTSYQACNEINQFYESANKKFHKIVG